MLNCTTCERFDGHKCLEFGHLIGMATCPYAVEKKPKNNYEMIQAMSMEELAEWRANGQCPGSKYHGDYDCANRTCEECWLDYLREEVKS